QGDGAEIVAHETVDVPLTLQLVLRARVVEIPGGVSHRAELPLALLLGGRQVEVEGVRIAAVCRDGRRTRRYLRPVGEMVGVVHIDAGGSEVPAVGRVAHP